MAATAKFLFDNDFSGPGGGREKSAAARAEMAQQAAEAEARGYQAGYHAARQEADNDSQRRHALGISQIGQTMTMMATQLTALENRLEMEALDVALACARKLCGELIAREPMAEITALMQDCMRELVKTPHLVLRIHDSLYESAKATIEDLAHKSGFEGRLIILAEPDLTPGDCRIEWADGGITRDSEAVAAQITELVNRYIAARTGAAMNSPQNA